MLIVQLKEENNVREEEKEELKHFHRSHGMSPQQPHDVISILFPTAILLSSSSSSPFSSSFSSSPTIFFFILLGNSSDMSSNKGKDTGEGSSTRSSAEDQQQQPPPLSRYESQKRRDWNTFGQFLKNQRPPVALAQCNSNQVLDFLRYLDQFGKTKVHLQGCVYFGQPEPPGPCTCPLKQAWGSLDALIGRLRAAYEENGGLPEKNPFASGAIRIYLREVRDSQAKARGVPYKKKKKKRNQMKANSDESNFPMQSM